MEVKFGVDESSDFTTSVQRVTLAGRKAPKSTSE